MTQSQGLLSLYGLHSSAHLYAPMRHSSRVGTCKYIQFKRHIQFLISPIVPPQVLQIFSYMSYIQKNITQYKTINSFSVNWAPSPIKAFICIYIWFCQTSFQKINYIFKCVKFFLPILRYDMRPHLTLKQWSYNLRNPLFTLLLSARWDYWYTFISSQCKVFAKSQLSQHKDRKQVEEKKNKLCPCYHLY